MVFLQLFFVLFFPFLTIYIVSVIVRECMSKCLLTMEWKKSLLNIAGPLYISNTISNNPSHFSLTYMFSKKYIESDVKFNLNGVYVLYICNVISYIFYRIRLCLKVGGSELLQ